MKHNIYFLTFLILVIACSTAMGPGKKSPRSFSWTIDTLDNFDQYQSRMSSIWGTTPDNVYTAGHNSGSYDGTLFHFDGKSWNYISWIKDLPGFINGEMLGFSEDNIWVCGTQGGALHERTGFFVHYDGISWKALLPKENNIPILGWLESLGGEYPDNFWAGGYNVLLKYNNGEWQPQPLDFPGARSGEYYIRDIAGNSIHGLYLILEVRVPSGSGYYYLYRLENNTWQQVLDSGSYPRYHELWMSPSGVLYFASGIGALLENGQLQEIEAMSDIYVYDIYGTSDSNIFLSGKSQDTSKFYHFNGNDWYEFEELATTGLIWPTGIWAGGNEVFIIGYTNDQRTVVYHGK